MNVDDLANEVLLANPRVVDSYLCGRCGTRLAWVHATRYGPLLVVRSAAPIATAELKAARRRWGRRAAFSEVTARFDFLDAPGGHLDAPAGWCPRHGAVTIPTTWIINTRKHCAR